MRTRDPSPPPASNLSILHPHATGIDVYSDMHMVCVPVASVPAPPVESSGPNP